MLRTGEIQTANQIAMNIFGKNQTGLISERIKPRYNFSKKELWKEFLKVFRQLYQKEFVQDEYTLSNLKVIFYYFLKDKKFYDCVNLREDIIVPNLSKGLLIIGGFGLGKTDYLKVFEKVFKNFSDYRFKFYSSKELVTKYELCQTPFDKEYFFKDISRKKMFIDDIGSERIASNYGKFDVIEEVLSHRYDHKLITFASCNYADKSQCVKSTIDELGVKYGSRIYDRLFESFNVIEFTGKSYRGRKRLN